MFAITTKTKMNNSMSSILLLLYMAILGHFLQVSHSLKVSALIPEIVKLGDPFWLNCSHHLQQQQQQQQHPQSKRFPSNEEAPKDTSKEWDDIYSIKWYKDDEEFYRFLPNGSPRVSIYETNGIQLNQAKSHEGNVYIHKADHNSEGNYRCEIVSEAPVFETVRKSKYLQVFAAPTRGPRIDILDSQGHPKKQESTDFYKVGKEIELRCSSGGSKPRAKLRWYINEQEITIPAGNTTTTRLIQLTTSSGEGAHYELRVTPTDFRLHHKGIYTSHSTLSLVFPEKNLEITTKISFKCLAQMRLEVPLRSKQLIALMPPLSSSSSSLVQVNRARREMQISPTDSMIALTTNNQRQRPQNQRHSVTRLQPQQQQQQQQQQNGARTKLINNNNLLFDETEPASSSHQQRQQQQQMLYIYEEANSALGSTIIDTMEGLESYLSGFLAPNNEVDKKQNFESATNYALNSNRATTATATASVSATTDTDNLGNIQSSLRERPFATSGRHRGAQTTVVSSRPRFSHSANTPAKSPLYYDEYDSLRPIINWPPQEAGKLQLLAPGYSSIVAIPFANFMDTASNFSRDEYNHQPLAQADQQEAQFRRILMEKLLRNMTCTCTDGSMNARLSWILNDNPLDTKDTRYYPSRVSPDHRHTILTIGFGNLTVSDGATAAFDSPPNSVRSSFMQQQQQQTTKPLKSVLANYLSANSNLAGRYKNSHLETTSSSSSSSVSSDQIRFSCQAIHSILLSSSSEVIVFDFTNPTNSSDITNSIDGEFADSSRRVQAVSASQSSSACSHHYMIKQTTQGSQNILFITHLAASICCFLLSSSSSSLVVTIIQGRRRAAVIL